MRVVSRKDFLELPEGTLYSKGKPQYFNGLMVKADSMSFDSGGSDFVSRDLIWVEDGDGTEMGEAIEDGKTRPMNTMYGRDGCFDDSDMFLVYEKDDLAELAKIIKEAEAAL